MAFQNVRTIPISGAQDAPKEQAGASSCRKIVVLTLTERCNLACVYCFESAKTQAVMTEDVAKAAIEYEFTHSEGFDEIEFDLFGGEPTLRFDLVRELVRWTCAADFGLPYLFFLETNGTLVHGEVQEWLQNHKHHIYAGLSLDGTPLTHNKNRNNSYDDIDIEFFATTYPDQSVRMTIYPDTVGNLASDIAHLHSLGFRDVVATFAHGPRWDSSAILARLGHQLAVLADYYLGRPDQRECSIFDVALSRVGKSRVDKWCGSGSTMVSYGVDGRRYPCHTFQGNTTGSKRALTCSELDFSAFDDFSDPECNACPLEAVCPNCYGMNYVRTGNVLTRDKTLCDVTRLRALATSYLRGQKIARGLNISCSAEMVHVIEGIRIVQSTYSHLANLL